MVYGDGDGQLFKRFTLAIDVIGHELDARRNAIHMQSELQRSAGRLERIAFGCIRIAREAAPDAARRRHKRTG